MADWTVNDPIKVKHDIVPQRQGSPLDLRVFVRFQDDATPTTNKFPDESQEAKIYTARGVGAWDQVREAVRRDRLTLNQGELPPADGTTFTPANAPTPIESAIEDMQEAVSRKVALVGETGDGGYKALMGKTNDDVIGVSAVTITQALGALNTAINKDVNNQANINRLLDNLPF